MEEKKQKFKTFFIYISIILLISYILLVYSIWSEIYAVFNKIETYLAILIIFSRMFILCCFTIFLLKRWFKQEAIYTSDAYFLFALFFIILIFGKGIDLLISLIYFSESYNFIYMLIFFKIRYIIITINAIPLLYLGLEVLMSLFDIYIKRISKIQFNLIKMSIVSLFLIINSIIILITPNLDGILSVLPIITTLTMVGIIILFALMYKIKRLSQAHGMIIAFGFFLVIISHILRPSLTKDFNISMLIIAELIDIMLYIIIFLGFIKKPPYIK